MKFHAILLVLCPFHSLAIKQSDDLCIIPNASYYITHEVDTKTNTYNYATYYTSIGDEITKINLKEFRRSLHPSHFYYNQESDLLSKKIDPHAPKPQPIHYAIKYLDGRGKGYSRYLIVFIDKNGNSICHFTYNEKTQKIIISDSIDTNNCKEVSLANLEKIDSINASNCTEHGSDEIKDYTKNDQDILFGNKRKVKTKKLW